MAKLLLVLAAFVILSAVVLSLPFEQDEGNNDIQENQDDDDDGNSQRIYKSKKGKGNDNSQGDSNAQRRDINEYFIEDEDEYLQDEDDLPPPPAFMTRLCPDLNANRPNHTAITFTPIGCLLASLFGFGR